MCVIVEHPRTLKDMLVSNRIYEHLCDLTNCKICPYNVPGSCRKMGCVYQITCSCGSSYIGESGRALSARISEHQRALWNPGKKSYVDTPLARHRVAAHHDDTPDIRVTILGVETDTVRRKILEAIWIKRVRPQINIKKEMEDALIFIH